LAGTQIVNRPRDVVKGENGKWLLGARVLPWLSVGNIRGYSA